MRKLLPALLLLFLITPSLLAQPRPRDFREANDSLQQRYISECPVDWHAVCNSYLYILFNSEMEEAHRHEMFDQAFLPVFF